MAKVTTYIDDLTGDTLTEDVTATTITVDGKDYSVDLGEVSKTRLLNWLNGEDSLIRAASPRATRGTRSNGKSSADKDRNAKVREWAKATGYKYKGTDGKDRTLGDRGAIPQVVLDAYDAAN